MEDSIAVSVKNISKKFRLFGSPKDLLREALHPFKRKYHHEFWALKDISFEVPKGMTLGIVGRNGDGMINDGTELFNDPISHIYIPKSNQGHLERRMGLGGL